MKRAVKIKLSDEAGNTALHVLLAVVVIVVVSLTGWKVYDARHTRKTTLPSTSTSSSASTATNTPLTSGTDNQSLSQDMTNLQNSITEGSQNLQAADSTTNDQQQAINVPTN